MKKKYLEGIKKGKWLLLGFFVASFFSGAFVKLLGLKDTWYNTSLVIFVLMIIPTVIFILINKHTKNKV